MTSVARGIPIEHLNDVERRLFELARRPMPLAEVAVRLGVATSEADRRIAELLTRLGFESRAALQRDFEARPDDERAARERIRRGRGVKRWLVVGGLGVTLVVLAAMLMWQGDQGSSPRVETQGVTSPTLSAGDGS
jgi:hypothetical protein